jgi:hypothetical protein
MLECPSRPPTANRYEKLAAPEKREQREASIAKKVAQHKPIKFTEAQAAGSSLSIAPCTTNPAGRTRFRRESSPPRNLPVPALAGSCQ